MLALYPKRNIDYPKRNVLLTEGVSREAREVFEKEGYSVVSFGDALAEDHLIRELRQREVHFLGIRSKTKVTKRVLLEAPKLQAIGCFCIGTDQVDLDIARTKGIPVFNSPHSSGRSVAELVIHYIIGLSRKTGVKNIEMNTELWNKSSKNCYEIRGKTLGIIGYGNIGVQVGFLAELLSMKVLFYDSAPKTPMGLNKKTNSMEALLRNSDFVTLHVPGNSTTRKLIGETQIAWMKKGSYLINASRGSVVDLIAVNKALATQQLAGFAADVYPEEPKVNGNWSTPIRIGYNVILTPHIGGSTVEAQSAIAEDVSNKYINYVNYGATCHAKNFPEISVVKKDSKNALILNVHRNEPGALRDINKCIEKYNIVQQVHSTLGNVGYIIIELRVSDGKELRQILENLPRSIRTRIRF